MDSVRASSLRIFLVLHVLRFKRARYSLSSASGPMACQLGNAMSTHCCKRLCVIMPPQILPAVALHVCQRCFAGSFPSRNTPNSTHVPKKQSLETSADEQHPTS
eukprot:8258523-Alexandrium_andersonii.AAC.2